MRGMADSSFSLIIADPPYYKVKKEAWDNQWKTEYDYLKWLSTLCTEWRRLLKPNGSIYVFASPEMASRVEDVMREDFSILNSVVWRKSNGNANWRACKEEVRSFLPNTERIIFAEQVNSDGEALADSMYAEACAELKRSIFGVPLEKAMRSLGMGHKQVAELTGCYGKVNHGGAVSNWLLGYNCPTADQWEKLRQVMGDLIPSNYNLLRSEYESRKTETDEHKTAFENLRRPFSLSSDFPYTDVWDFPTVSARQDKHICEKPLAMMEHIVRVSSRAGDSILDPFAGSFVVGSACLNLKRDYVGIERDGVSIYRARKLIELGQGERPNVTPVVENESILPLFAVDEVAS